MGASANFTFNSGTNLLFVNGNISANGDVCAQVATSDIRLKENIREIENALGALKNIRGVRYDWTDEFLERRNENGLQIEKNDVGVVAQEVKRVLPEVVELRNDGYYGVRYEKITALLIQAIKELDAKVDLILKKE